MLRKEFLRLASLPFLTYPLLSSAFYRPQISNKKVIIIGAGMAGASCAYHLKKAGIDVVIFEARNRIGGRIKTDYNFKAPVDFGASWIHHPKGNPLVELAQTSNTNTVPTDFNDVFFMDEAGHTVHRVEMLNGYMHYLKMLRKSNKYIADHQDDISMQEMYTRFMNKTNLSEKDKLLLHFIENLLQANGGDDFKELSSRAFFADFNRGHGNDKFVTDGYKKILDKLLDQVEIRLNEKVIAVEQTGSFVSIETTTGKYDADAVVITVPISVLQKGVIRFSPALPNYKTQAISKLRLGLMNKTVMQFSEPFWKTHRQFMSILSAEKNEYDLIVNLQQISKQPILVALCSRGFAMDLEHREQKEIETYWQNYFNKAFPNKNIEFEKTVSTAWHTDEFSQGSFSYIAVSTTTKDIASLAQPFNKLFFAGEATDLDDYSSVEGAYKSGKREAKAILQM